MALDCTFVSKNASNISIFVAEKKPCNYVVMFYDTRQCSCVERFYYGRAVKTNTF